MIKFLLFFILSLILLKLLGKLIRWYAKRRLQKWLSSQFQGMSQNFQQPNGPFQGFADFSQASKKSSANSPLPQVDEDNMVECAYCHVFIPDKTAYTKGQHVFCNVDHAKAFHQTS